MGTDDKARKKLHFTGEKWEIIRDGGRTQGEVRYDWKQVNRRRKKRLNNARREGDWRDADGHSGLKFN